MNGLLVDLGPRWLEYFGLAVLQNTLFVGVVLLILRWYRNAPASVRYAIAMVGLAKLLLPPFLPLPTAVAPTAEPTALTGLISTFTFGQLPAGGATPTGSGSIGVTVSGLLLAAWALFALVYLVAYLVGTLRLSARLAAATPVAPAELPIDVRDRGITVLRSDQIGMPLTVGVFPRRIFVPEFWDHWPADRRDLILRHELAHIRRHDGLVKICQIIARALYFFHPLVWLLDRRLDEYREMACDDASIASGKSSPVDFARHLVEIAELAVTDPVAFNSASTIFRKKNELLRRVRYQVKERKMRSGSKLKAMMVLVGLALLVFPLSWYHGQVVTSDAVAGKKKQIKTAEGKLAKAGKEMSIRLLKDGGTLLEGEPLPFEKLAQIVAKIGASHPDDTIVKLSCEDGVKMGTLYKVQKLLRKNEIAKVKFVNDAGKGLPMTLPQEKAKQKLAQMAKSDLATVKINAKGKCFLDGKKCSNGKLGKTLVAMLAENEFLVVIIQTEEATSYDDFAMVMETVHGAEAKRVVVNPPS